MTDKQIEELNRILLDWENEGGDRVFTFVEGLLATQEKQLKIDCIDEYQRGYRDGVKDEIECVETSGEHLELQKKLEGIPFVAFGNNELGEQVGDCAVCPHCKKKHKVEYGETINKDGTKSPNKVLGFVKCGKESYLVAIDEKLIKV